MSCFDTAVQRDPDFGLLPETRCSLCSYERLESLSKDSGNTQETAPMFPAVQHDAKFSWEPGAVPMDKKADGTYDGTGWFQGRPATYDRYRTCYRSWGSRINEKRHDMDASLPKLPVELFRPHSGRHGAVLNLKRAKVPASIGAAHCCMSMHFWDTVYGLEDATESGEMFTGSLLVGKSASACAVQGMP